MKLIVRAAHFMHRLNHQDGRECSPTPKRCPKEGRTRPLVSAEQALSLSKQLELVIDTWLKGKGLVPYVKDVVFLYIDTWLKGKCLVLVYAKGVFVLIILIIISSLLVVFLR